MTSLMISNIAIWVIAVIQSVALLAIIRQLGILHDRIAPVGALMLSGGLKVGEPAPIVEVSDLNGRPLVIGAPRSDGCSTLVMFVSPTCPVCKELLPVLKSSQKSEAAWLDVLLASDGNAVAQREFIREYELGAFGFVISTHLGMTYHVTRLPFAVLIDEAGVLRARGLINSREHMESLFEAKRLGVGSIQEFLEARSRTAAAPLPTGTTRH